MSHIKIKKTTEIQTILDEIDKKLIFYLEQNCNETNENIANQLKLSRRVVEYRINRLVENGIILGFFPFFDFSKLGYVNHEVWLQLTIPNEQSKKAFYDYLVNCKEVGWVAECSGTFDCAIGIMANDSFSFSKIFKKIIQIFPTYIDNYYVMVSTAIYAYPRSYLLDYTENRDNSEKILFEQPKRVLIDSSDMDIIRVLSKNAKVPIHDLSKMVGISHNTARKRINNLEQRGIIKGYNAVIRPSSLGIQNYEVLVKMAPLTLEMESEIREFCRKNQNILYLIWAIGKWDLNFVVDAENISQFQIILNQFKVQFGRYIKEIDSVRVLDIYKYKYQL